jgi:CRP/FNR family transcriptional regulator, cyclic AMP receptor protein
MEKPLQLYPDSYYDHKEIPTKERNMGEKTQVNIMTDQVITLKKDKYLVHEGEESTEMYYLQSGSLAVIKRKGTVEQIIGNIYGGELVGELSFLDKKPRSASVKALSDCQLIAIPHPKLDSTLKSLPPWLSALLRTLVDRLRHANAKIKV